MINDYNNEQLHRLEPAYLARYGLTEPPFAASLDDRFFYPTAELSQHVNMLVHMTQYSDMLLLVTGEEGMGKTALLQYYLKAAHENWHVCRINANSMMDVDQLLFRIAEGFGMESLPGNSAELQELLLDKLGRLHQNDILPVVIIDDADELPQDAIELLYHLAEVRAEDGPSLHIVLFADPRIENTLQSSSVRSLVDRITHTLELQTLTEEETIEYINNRLVVAGAGDEVLFTPKVYKKIFKASGGVPARINELAHMALDDNEPAEPEGAAADDVYQQDDEDYMLEKPRSTLRMVLYASLAIILATVLWQQDKINRLINGEDIKEVLSSKPDIDQYMPKNQPEPDAESPFVETPEDKEKIIEFTPQTASPSAKPDKPDTAQQSPTKAIEAPVKSTAQPQTKPKPPALLKIEPIPVLASNTTTELVLHGKNFTPLATVTLSWTGNSRELPADRYTVESDSLIRLRLNPGRNPDKWTVTVTDPGSGISNTLLFNTIHPAKQVKIQTDRKDQSALAWVMAQPDKHYSLQLLGSHSEKPLQAYIKKHRLLGGGKIIKTTLNDKAWYILLSGSYPNKESAQKAVQSMSKQARRNKPWIRSFASIQQQLKKAAAEKPKSITKRQQPKLDNLKAHEAWIWSQDPGHVTLQLMGTHSISRLQQFIKRHSLRGKVVYYHTQRDGKDWYALIYGNYADNKLAKNAVAALPDVLKKQRPWIRSFSAIHAEMDKASNP